VARDLGVDFLGSVPLDPMVVDCGDDGRPLVRAAPESPAAESYRGLAATLGRTGAEAGGLATPFAWTLADGAGKPTPVAPAATGTADRLAALDHDGGAVVLRWMDGAEQRLADRDLRLACQCAQCRDEMTGERLVDAEAVPLDLRLTRVWSVGNYALGMAFSDGHDTGIYTFRALRAMSGTELEDV
jgi:ATP-binding protein involved in chromosome partitioning